ncbi:hypothetical protein L7F22_045277 [Adiantum nelumboides]|nr:hypothetical protein [Adiantum nelumboides]
MALRCVWSCGATITRAQSRLPTFHKICPAVPGLAQASPTCFKARCLCSSSSSTSVQEASSSVQAPPLPPSSSEETTTPEASAPPDLDALDIRVGKIIKAWKHPEADSLYVEEIDLAEPEGPRTICSGLVKYVPLEELQVLFRIVVNLFSLHQAMEWARTSSTPLAILLLDFEKSFDRVDWGFLEGSLDRMGFPLAWIRGVSPCIDRASSSEKHVLVLANLKPRNMRGVKSNGMLLAASDESHEHVELLVPSEGSVAGERAWFGTDADKQSQKDAATPNQLQKKKIWESVQPELKTSEECVAMFQGKPMRTTTGLVTSKSLKGANVG